MNALSAIEQEYVWGVLNKAIANNEQYGKRSLGILRDMMEMEVTKNYMDSSIVRDLQMVLFDMNKDSTDWNKELADHGTYYLYQRIITNITLKRLHEQTSSRMDALHSQYPEYRPRSYKPQPKSLPLEDAEIVGDDADAEYVPYDLDAVPGSLSQEIYTEYYSDETETEEVVELKN